MEIPTFTVTTPIQGKEVTLKSYITGREKRALTSVFLTGDVQFSADAQDIKGLKGSLIEKAEDLAISTIVVAVNGKKEGIVDEVLNMHATDYAFVIAEINKVTRDDKGEELKKN